jgi:hypothetical protein
VSSPRLTVPRPDGFAAAPDAPVPVPEGSPARRVDHVELTGGAARVIAECFAAQVPGWSEELRGPVEGRTTAMLAATVERRLGLGVRVSYDPSSAGLTLHAVDDGRALAEGKTLLGFDGDAVHTCYVACVAPDATACRGAVRAATLRGGSAAPPPGILLASAAGVVRHPREASAALVGVAIAIGAAAVLTRRRPRTRV